MSTKPNGEVRACCRSTPIDSLNDSKLEDVWNGEKLKTMRKQMLDGGKPKACKACWRDEDLGIKSLRMMANETVLDQVDFDSINSDHTMPFVVRFLELKLSNLCNFKCRMCYPTDSSLWGIDWAEVSSLYQKYNTETYDYLESIDIRNNPYISAFKNNEGFWKSWEAIRNNVNRLQFAGGEPLIDPMHYDILTSIDLESRSKILLAYSTNFSKLNYKNIDIFKLWQTFKTINVETSIDGHGSLYEYIRTNGNYEELWENIGKISRLDNVNLIIKICLSAYNILRIDQILDDFEERLSHLEFYNQYFLLQSFVKYPQWLNVAVLPKEVKRAAVQRFAMRMNTYKNESSNLLLLNAIRSISIDDDKHEGLLPEFVDYVTALDRKRSGIGFTDLYPEMVPYF
jgi:sulfatase maturation enzyme AslB (radical SAM superfamily)